MGQAKVEHTGEYKLTADNGHGRDEVRVNFSLFLAVQNSSIGDLVTDSLTH